MLNRLLRTKKRKNQFKWEIEGLKGMLPAMAEADPSIFHFSMNKAATQFIKRILKENAQHNNLKLVDYHGHFFSEGNNSYLDRMSEAEFNEYQYLFQPRGYIYSSFGGPLMYLKDDHQYRKVVIIRDPRDILVSTYFSVAYSHALPNEESAKQRLLSRRERVVNMDINDFVLEQSSSLLLTCNKYISYLPEHEQSLFWKYEEITSRFEEFLNALEISLDFRLESKHRNDYLKEMSTVDDAREDVNSHRRRVTPGDYLNKLRKGTIDRLDDIFNVFLVRFGYK